MKPKGNPAARGKLQSRETLFALLCGVWIGLSLLKFGNPIILDRLVGVPKDQGEFLTGPWPISWGYLIFVGVVVAAFPLLKARASKADWPLAFLAFWLGWQFLSNTRSVDPRLSNPTVVHFVSCGVALLLGWWALAPLRSSKWFWTPVLLASFWVLFLGFDQHAGGLEATRKHFYAQANWQLYPKDYLLRIESNRIFSTLVYPNALAGFLLLFLPALLWQAWELTVSWPRVLRGVFVGLFGYLGFACFYWTGSKGGWLIALIIIGVLALQTKIPKRLKTALVVGGVILGVAAFFIRFNAYFQKGATSVGARFEYWRAARQVVATHPILGSGPGTFSVEFKRLKRPEAEMAKLVHNDYLEQASDSGIPGAIAFAGGISTLLVILYRKVRGRVDLDFLLWLGLLGSSLQAFIEFGLYIPAIAWPSFLFFGVLWSKARSPTAE